MTASCDAPVCPCCGQVIPPPPKHRHWTDEEDARLNAMIRKGLGHSEIARALKRPNSSIRSRLLTLEKGPVRMARAARQPVEEVESVDADAPATSEVVRPGVRIITHRLV